MYSLTTLRKRAYKAGYRIEKGFQHYMYNDAVCRDCNGDGIQDIMFGIYRIISLCGKVVAIMAITIIYVL